MLSPPLPPCTTTTLLLLIFILTPLIPAIFIPIATEPITCPPGTNPTCCPCITSDLAAPCGDPQPIDQLADCARYHPLGWACCVEGGDNPDWGCVTAKNAASPPENFTGDSKHLPWCVSYDGAKLEEMKPSMGQTV